jgi:hypothetical protein
MRTTFFLALLVLSTPPRVRSDCKCAQPDKKETTRWGGNEVVVIVEETSVKRLQGTVKGPDGTPIAEALVEIFTHPEFLLSDLPNSNSQRPEQQRVAACVTEKDGKFCFRRVPPGTYELRSSISTGWDVTKVHLTVDPKKGKAKKVIVTMHLGT